MLEYKIINMLLMAMLIGLGLGAVFCLLALKTVRRLMGLVERPGGFVVKLPRGGLMMVHLVRYEPDEAVPGRGAMPMPVAAVPDITAVPAAAGTHARPRASASPRTSRTLRPTRRARTVRARMAGRPA